MFRGLTHVDVGTRGSHPQRSGIQRMRPGWPNLRILCQDGNDTIARPDAPAGHLAGMPGRLSRPFDVYLNVVVSVIPTAPTVPLGASRRQLRASTCGTCSWSPKHVLRQLAKVASQCNRANPSYCACTRMGVPDVCLASAPTRKRGAGRAVPQVATIIHSYGTCSRAPVASGVGEHAVSQISVIWVIHDLPTESASIEQVRTRPENRPFPFIHLSGHRAGILDKAE